MRKRLSFKFAMFIALILLIIALVVASIKVGALVMRHYAGSMSDKEDVVELLNEGNYERVLILAQNSLQLNPVDSAAHAFAGMASYYLGIYSYNPQQRAQYLRSATYHLRLAIALGEDFTYLAQVHYTLAQVYVALDEYYSNLVINHAQKSKQLGYEPVQLNELLGISYIRVGENELGLEYLLAANDGQRSAEFYTALGEAYALVGRFQEAQMQFYQALTMSSDDGLRDRIEKKLAKVYYDMGRLQEAKELYIMLLRKYPNDAQLHFVLGKIYEEEGLSAQARASWQQALRLDPQNSEAYARIYG